MTKSSLHKIACRISDKIGPLLEGCVNKWDREKSIVNTLAAVPALAHLECTVEEHRIDYGKQISAKHPTTELTSYFAANLRKIKRGSARRNKQFVKQVVGKCILRVTLKYNGQTHVSTILYDYEHAKPFRLNRSKRNQTVLGTS